MIRSSMPSPFTSPASIAETPTVVARQDAGQAEAVAAVEARQSKRGRLEARCCRRRHSLAGEASPARIGPERADDQVVQAVAVHVAGTRHEAAATVAGGDAVDAEAVACRRGRTRRCWRRSRPRCRRRRSFRRHWPGRRDRPRSPPMIRSSMPSPFTSPAAETEDAGVIVRIDAVEAEAVAAVEARQVEGRRKPAAAAEDDVGRAGVAVRRHRRR